MAPVSFSPPRIVTARLTLSACLGLLALGLQAQPAYSPTGTTSPFFEPGYPFAQSKVEITPGDPSKGGNLVIRGILLPLADGVTVSFDQELLRVAGVWVTPPGQPMVTLRTMAQISYAVNSRKADHRQPQPAAPAVFATAVAPGITADPSQVGIDPRPAAVAGDLGRGPLPRNLARFDGLELTDSAAVLRYRAGATAVREWHAGGVAADGTIELRRHLEVAPSEKPVVFVLANGAWKLDGTTAAHLAATDGGKPQHLAVNSGALTFSQSGSSLIATLAPSRETRRFTIALSVGTPVAPSALAATPAPPAASSAQRWPGTAITSTKLGVVNQNGLAIDRLELPEPNSWNRRVRIADIAFLTPDRAMAVSYDGDVWQVDGVGSEALDKLTWKRYASGLHEPLAIVVADGQIQVGTKNGLVRLHDRDGNGEADWYENFNDEWLQSQSTRSFILDMALAPDGSTFITQGAIVTGGTGTAHSGGFIRVARDGSSASYYAGGAREPFVAIHPVTGQITGTDQQGNFIPSTPSYLVRPGDNFGFNQDNPVNLAKPLVWVPHDQNISASSEFWFYGAGLGAWNNRRIQLSYGNGRMLLIDDDLSAPTPQGSVIPLGLELDLPLLHGRMHPDGKSAFLAGFKIWGTRTAAVSTIARLRPSDAPMRTATGARSGTEGVLLRFDAPLDPASVTPDKVGARLWNYKRSKDYGSGRYRIDGEPGTKRWPVSQVVLAPDRRSVFVHLPEWPAVQQAEIQHDFLDLNGNPVQGKVFLTVHQHQPLKLAAAGFKDVDLSLRRDLGIPEVEEPLPSVKLGETVANTVGCVACHSIDGTTEGKVGTSWKGLARSMRTFIDGSQLPADKDYLYGKIMNPQSNRIKAGELEMPSYQGVLSDSQVQSLILYIESLR
ncbi:MAG TPA: DUF6797 domain-containing protein [Opitutaceae bacterium]